MKRKWQKHSFSTVVVLGVLLCVCIALGGFAMVEGQLPVWSDNFNDGTYAPEWTVQEGSYSATNLQLEAGVDVWNWIHHASTVAYGEWRFDVCCETVAGIRVAFLALDTSGVGYQRPNDGYYLEIIPNNDYIRLYRNVGGVASVMGGYTVVGLLNTPLEVIVTRNTTGYFHVWINGVHQIQAQHNGHTTSVYFIVLMVEGGYIDNIEVYDEIITEYEDGNGNGSTTTQFIPGFPAVAITLGIVSALTIGVLYRRRQAPLPSK